MVWILIFHITEIKSHQNSILKTYFYILKRTHNQIWVSASQSLREKGRLENDNQDNLN
jgi:hypothetical protein